MITVQHLYRYPVKGLTPEPLERVRLARGQGFPVDRHYALALPETEFDERAPAAVPKTKFLMLAKNERLAALRTRFDDASGTFSVSDRAGAPMAHGHLGDPAGRAALEEFFHGYAKDELSGRPRLVHAPGHQFTDVSVVSETMMRAISLINLASLRAVEKAAGKPVHHLRFRANLYFDGAEPWAEFDWMDKEIAIGGTALRIIFRTKRCPATQVNPETAERDIDTPRVIRRAFGYADLGVYAEVLGDGEIKPGDIIEAPRPAA